MASYNLVVIAGNLTRDVEVRYIASGTAVADVTVAVNDRRKQPNGEWVDEVSFVDVTLWGRTAEIAGEYLSKGSNILIEGRLRQDRWEKDGQKFNKLRVTCERMVMLGGRGAGQEVGGGRSQGASANRGNPSRGSSFEPPDDYAVGSDEGPAGGSGAAPKEDIPF